MKQNKLHRYTLIIVGMLLFASCQQVVIKIENLPSNTPANQAVYVAGNFNNWDPGDENYRLEQKADGSYYITLPSALGTVEFKFTRGDWTSVEKDICGYEIDDRYFKLGHSDTVVQTIASWGDLDPVNCPRLTLVVKGIPENTPTNDQIVVAGDYNAWNPDEGSVMEKDSFGNYSVTLNRPLKMDMIEFKITRGDLAMAESDEFGNELPSRKVYFGQKDTIEIDVKGWIDKPGKKASRVYFIIDNLPKNTPAHNDIYLVSSINNWTPGDQNYIFQRNKQGQLFFPVPKKRKTFEFKITRGDWWSVEVDRFGFEMPNRSVDLLEADTVHINVEGWKDITTPNHQEVTVLISSLPDNTPEKPNLYITGSFNNWNASRSRYKFAVNANGKYYTTVPHDKHDIEFKISRGSWESIEIDKYGSDIPNRQYDYWKADTIFVDVENWKDLPDSKTENVTLVLNELPSNTPANSCIYLVSDFNGWDPLDESLVFDSLPDGRPYLTFRKRNSKMSYKITRGTWSKVEVGKIGNEIPDRELTFGFSDTVYIDIIKWRDLDGRY